MGMGTAESVEESPDLCRQCGREMSDFLSGNEYLCLECHDALSGLETWQLIKNIGKLMDDIRAMEGSFKAMKKMIKDHYGVEINTKKGKSASGGV